MKLMNFFTMWFMIIWNKIKKVFKTYWQIENYMLLYNRSEGTITTNNINKPIKAERGYHDNFHIYQEELWTGT